jgi:hypothetical protein
MQVARDSCADLTDGGGEVYKPKARGVTMKKNGLFVVLVAIIAGLAVVVVRQHQELNQLREVAAKPPVVEATTPVRPVAQVPEPEPNPGLSPSPPVAQPQAAASTPVASIGPVAPEQKSPNFLAAVSKMAKDPAFKDMMRNQQKVMLDMMYGGLFKSLNLPAEDLDALKQLLVDRQMALADGGMAIMSGELSAADRAQKAKEIEQVKADYDKKIQDFLGAEDYAVFKDYEQTQSERVQVNMFKQSLASADALTEQQEADLVAAMYQERKNLPDPDFMRKTAPDPAKFTEEGIAEMQEQLEQLQDKYLQSAAKILNATQLEQFKKSSEQQRAMQAMGLKMAAQMFGQQQQSPQNPAPPKP